MGFSKNSIFSMLLLGTFLGACSQGRESLLAGDRSKWWGPQKLCSDGGENCFEVSINLSYNEAYFYVERVEPLALQLGYRVAIRFEDSNTLELLGSNLDYGAGEEFTLSLASGDITQVAEWYVETAQNASSNGLNFSAAPLGNGVVMANKIIDWPELFRNNSNYNYNNSSN